VRVAVLVWLTACGSAGSGARPHAPPVLGSARRPDPSPWVPSAEAEGAPAPTGELAGLAPGGPYSAARSAYLDLVRKLLADDMDGLTEMLAPQVGLLSRPQTAERSEVARRLRMRFRAEPVPSRLEDVVEPRDVRVRPIDPDAPGSTVVQSGDLQVTADLRLRTQRSPFGGWDESPTLSLVLRRQEGRWTVVAIEF
jgi:hypothetical protein